MTSKLMDAVLSCLQVQCYPCNSCNTEGLKLCVKEKHKMFHCMSPMQDVSVDKVNFIIPHCVIGVIKAS